MLTYAEMRGAIFDVDDTLLDNHPDGSLMGLHEQSRLMAAHEIGRRYNNSGLQQFTEQQSIDAFREAKAHTLQAAVWQMLYMAGEVRTDAIDPAHPLLNEMMDLKDELHEQLLRTKGREVPGAGSFVRRLASQGLVEYLGIASTASRRDIDIFLDMSSLEPLFADSKIISRERFTHGKPHPEAFDRAFTALELSESARPCVVAFEDDPRGIASAKAAELFTCTITTRFDRERLQALDIVPDLIADSYEEFHTYFSQARR